MHQSVWSNGLDSSSNIWRHYCTAEPPPSSGRDPSLSVSDDAAASVNCCEGGDEIKMKSKDCLYSGVDVGSYRLSASGDTDLLSSGRHPASPASSLMDWPLNDGHQGKRARVENIIKGMRGGAGAERTDVATHQHLENDSRIQRLPLRRERHGFVGVGHSQMARKESERLKRLRTMFNHVDGASGATSSVIRYPTWNSSPQTASGGSRPKHRVWQKAKLRTTCQARPERMKVMAEVLKQELSRVVSWSVDSVFKSLPLLQVSPKDQGVPETDVPLWPSVSKDDDAALPRCGDTGWRVPDVQTEALSLVVEKPPLEVHQSRSRTLHRPEPPTLHGYDPPLHEAKPSAEQRHYTPASRVYRSWNDGCSDVAQAKFGCHKVGSKVSHRSVISPNSRSVWVDPMLLQSLPHVKIESGVKNNLNMLNEGLTTNHLKKAKLMFFFTRYPNSQVLKTCFHEVQFTRCIVSQLTKWFSNFREFFYIQMEKFARQVLTEGTAQRGLTVGRESELFRTLSVHYNRASDFQVPDRFLEVAEITLREFYESISAGKDGEPSWKKAIYKVICKLDGEVPAEFSSSLSGGEPRRRQ